MIKLQKMHWVLIAAVIAALLALTYYQYSQVDKPKTEIDSTQVIASPALTVRLVKPQLTNIQQVIAANGAIAPWQEAVIGSESNGLLLNQVLVNVGDKVKRGQLLAEFSTATIMADIAQAQANIAEAKANALEAAGNAARARNIQDTGALSTQQIEQYFALEATSKARVTAAVATLQMQQIKLKQTKVIAPDNGVISARAATVGAVVSPGQELFKLIRQGRLEWRAELASSDIGQIKDGMISKLNLPDGSAITGKVRTTSPIVDAQTRNAIVFVDINADQAKAGMFARGTFEIGDKPQLTLPNAAIVMKDGFAYVMQVGANKRVKQVKVTTGQNQGAVTALTGLDENADYIAAGGAFLTDGDLVAISQQETTP